MKNNAHNIRQSSIGNKIMRITLAVLFALCGIIIANNVNNAGDSGSRDVKVENSIAANTKLIYDDSETITLDNLEYGIKSVKHQKDIGNPLLGEHSEYIVITMKVKNRSSKDEAFDAFDMILRTTVNGERKNIRNISDTTIYNVASGAESEIKLIYIVPNDSEDIHIISEKNDKNDIKIE